MVIIINAVSFLYTQSIIGHLYWRTLSSPMIRAYAIDRGAHDTRSHCRYYQTIVFCHYCLLCRIHTGSFGRFGGTYPVITHRIIQQQAGAVA